MTGSRKNDFDERESIHPSAPALSASGDTHVDLRNETDVSTVISRVVCSKSAESTTEGAVPEPEDLAHCPDCGSELSDPEHIGWCLRCGYCRYLENVTPIAALPKQPLDPEVQWAIDLFRALGKRFKGVTITDPELMRYMDLVETLGKRYKKNPPTIEQVRGYHDLLQALGKKLKTEESAPIPVTGYYDLLYALSKKFKEELDASAKGRRWLLPGLNIPLPALASVPDWLAVLVCGLLVCALGSFTSGLNLRGAPQSRLTWVTFQVSFGVLVILAAQASAFLMIVPPRLRLRKWFLAVWPAMLWWAVWHRLPETRWPLWLLIWGGALGVGAVLMLLL